MYTYQFLVMKQYPRRYGIPRVRSVIVSNLNGLISIGLFKFFGRDNRRCVQGSRSPFISFKIADFLLASKTTVFKFIFGSEAIASHLRLLYCWPDSRQVAVILAE
jgi:hypothetical protein